MLINIQGPISPIQAEYLERGLALAAEQKASVIIIQIDTPGGSIDVMERMVKAIRGSLIPVVTYVSPHNAMAGSAGTLITLAGHLSAMAPETTIGAASPVGEQGQDIGQTMEEKVKEILKASARNLAKNRSPEAIALAEETIASARAVTVDEAVRSGLVDLKSGSVSDLLDQINGRKVLIVTGEVTLKTRGLQAEELPNTIIESVLLLLINPNLVFLLLAIGVQAILIELSSPGGWVAGFIGAVCLMLAVYGLGVLPVNWFGALFLVMAFILFIVDIKAPTHGALTAAGTVSFITGALVLFNTSKVPGMPQVSVPLVIGTGVIFALIFFTIITIAVRAQKSPVLTGKETLVGQEGFVSQKLEPIGIVRVGGELWSAALEDEKQVLEPGARIQVVQVDGIKLVVRKKGDI
jgi:membrane-bound serine protease (ClpP class)